MNMIRHQHITTGANVKRQPLFGIVLERGVDRIMGEQRPPEQRVEGDKIKRGLETLVDDGQPWWCALDFLLHTPWKIIRPKSSRRASVTLWLTVASSLCLEKCSVEPVARFSCSVEPVARSCCVEAVPRSV